MSNLIENLKPQHVRERYDDTKKPICKNNLKTRKNIIYASIARNDSSLDFG
jgi:hypothetical protein